MQNQNYFSKYRFDWDMLDVVINGKSALDAETFLGEPHDLEKTLTFLEGYGVSQNDPIKKAELFGNFQEALQFIKRYFLKEGNKENGLDLLIPNSIFMISDLRQLVEMAIAEKAEDEEKLKEWAEVILKVVHTILHVDKDLRSNYFKIIQTQIFDKFYRYMNRDKENKLFLGVSGEFEIPLLDFDTKSKKTRDSVILKLLHKAENVAEELFDRVGIRFITESKVDCIRVVNFLIKNYVIVPQNIKPSRSMNTVFDLDQFRLNLPRVQDLAENNNLEENRFLDALEREIEDEMSSASMTNNHSSASYKSIQFTCRQLIRYREPFLMEFNKVKEHLKDNYKGTEIYNMVNALDSSNLARDIEFFYPYEVQIMDEESYENNNQGDASHSDYKKSQIISARDRLFKKFL